MHDVAALFSIRLVFETEARASRWLSGSRRILNRSRNAWSGGQGLGNTLVLFFDALSFWAKKGDRCLWLGNGLHLRAARDGVSAAVNLIFLVASEHGMNKPHWEDATAGTGDRPGPCWQSARLTKYSIGIYKDEEPRLDCAVVTDVDR